MDVVLSQLQQRFPAVDVDVIAIILSECGNNGKTLQTVNV